MTCEAFPGVPCTVNTGMGNKGLVTRVSSPSATRVGSADQAVRLGTPRHQFGGGRVRVGRRGGHVFGYSFRATYDIGGCDFSTNPLFVNEWS